MKKVYVCSPCSGEIEKNTEKCRGYCRFAVENGFVPIAPHIYFTQFLDDRVVEERNLGLKIGIELLKECDAVWVFGDVVSDGMKREIEVAKELNKQVLFLSKPSFLNGVFEQNMK